MFRTQMSVDQGEIEEQLRLIASTLSGFDTSGFFATLLATLLGAAIAGLASYFIYHRERNERYTTQLDEVASVVMMELHEYSCEHRRFIRDVTEWAAAQVNNPSMKLERPKEPDRSPLDIALDVLIVKSKRDDRRVAEAVRD